MSTAIGGQLAINDCIVTSSRKSTYDSTDNFDHGTNYPLCT